MYVEKHGPSQLNSQLNPTHLLLLGRFGAFSAGGLIATLLGEVDVLLSQNRPSPSSLMLALKKPVAGETGALLCSSKRVLEFVLPALALDKLKKLGKAFRGFFPKSFTRLAPLYRLSQ